MMTNKAKKIFSCVAAISVLLTMLCSQSVYADNKNSTDTIGMVNSNVPYIQVEIKQNDLEKSDISGKLGSEDISLYNVNKLEDSSVLTCILIDNSKSMTQDNICPSGSFNELKSGITSLISANVSDKKQFAVYSIGEGDPKKLGIASDDKSAKTLNSKINSLKGNEDATNLNEALNLIFDNAINDKARFQVVKFLLVTDTSADYGTGIDISETNDKFQYNKFPLYTICNTVSENSSTYKKLRTLSRNSGGEAVIYNYKKSKSSASLINKTYKKMTSGSIACFVSNKAIDNKARELTVNVNGTAHSETILLDSAADINAPVKAKVSFDESNNAFNICYSQKGFDGNLPVNSKALDISSYKITKSGKNKSFDIQKVKLNSDGSYTVFMKKDVYSGTYDFEFKDITDLSSKSNTIDKLENVEIKAKNNFWKIFPYLMILLAVIIVLLAFYLILLNLKKKKNVKTIKELFETQVSETVEEHHHIVRAAPQKEHARLILYFKTGNMPQKRMQVDIESSLIIGRSSICDVYIDDAKMSRQHFAIEYSRGCFMITDLESANGTYVNGIRVVSRQKLNSGDMITAGLSSIRIEF